ncbi:MAG: ChaN family lipoprotein, partial [Planctomycetota bacterium JB042]
MPAPALRRFLTLLPLPLLLAACAAPTGEPTLDDVPWAAPALARTAFPFHTEAGAPLPLDALFDRLAGADVVFLGETHLDEETHRFEHAVYEALIERTGGRVVLAMEMFERDVQPSLDAYLAGELDEREFLKGARPWGNYRTAYRRLIETATREGLPVIASNAPRPVIRKIGGTQSGLDALSAEERALLPEEIHDNTAAYWERVDNAIRGHAGMMGGGGERERRLSTQALWDNSMGAACARALEEFPGWVVLHVNGGFHSSYREGTVHQLMLRAPDADVVTVAIDPTVNAGGATAAGRRDADVVAFVESRARDVNGGFHAVTLSRELEYRLHVPAAATDDAPVPLLIWLGDDDRTAADGMARWRRRLGEECAIAVPRPLWTAPAEDLLEGGTWFRDSDFMSDVAAASTAVARIWGSVARNLPVDGRRVVVAGEGTGATVAVAAALHAGPMPVRAVALAPSRARGLRDLSLPLPADDGTKATQAVSIDVRSDEEWWDGELEQYEAIGVDARRDASEADPWSAEGALEDRLRLRLGLAARSPSEAGPAHVVVPIDSPRGRAWARLAALRHAEERGGPVAVLGPDDPVRPDSTHLPLDVSPAAFAAPGMLPRAPGPFGGTTVLVLPESVDA